MKEALETALGDKVSVTIGPGRQSSFEVTAGGKLLYSKLQTKSFPETNDQVVDLVKAAMGGKDEGKKDDKKK